MDTKQTQPADRCRMNRKQDQLLVLAQHVQQRSARLLQRHGQLLVRKTGHQSVDPILNRFRTMPDVTMFSFACRRYLQRPDMFLVRPIDTHIGSKLGILIC
jgi:hypothetical protein